jgi:hypothetical protein
MPRDDVLCADGIGENEAQPLTREGLRRGSLCVARRKIDPAIEDLLDRLPLASLPHIRMIASMASLRSDLAKAFADGSQWSEGGEWISRDVEFLARLFCGLTGITRFSLRLETITTDACAKFHADNVRFRLITTYRGPGTEWIPPGFDPSSEVVPKVMIRRLERGWIAIMRGRKSEGRGRPALLHRSPPIAGTGVSRIFLAINDAADAQPTY